jgi:hypothetical protein
MGKLRIFLCYRRDDTRWVAGRLYDELRQRYGPEQVFQDITAIRPGIRYTDQIQEEISRCDVLVVMMGEGWLSAADPQGRRRLDSPRDLVRLEIAAALQRGIPIIPVLIQRASMPADVELPDDIADLALYHACEVTDTRWDYDVGVLLRAIDAFAGESVPAETSAVGGQPGTIRRQPAKGGKAEHYRAFWTRFLERVRAEHPDWTTARIPQKDNWITMPSGMKGAVYGCNFAAGGRLRAELYIDSGDGEANLELFRTLKERAQAIEAAYGKALSWEELPGRRACRIADYADGDVTNTDQHDAYIDWFFDAGIRLRGALAIVDTSQLTAEPLSVTEAVMPKVGDRFLGTVNRTTTFGAFVSLTSGKEGLLHITRLGKKGQRVRNVEDVVNVGDKLMVEVMEVDRKNRMSLKLVEEAQ